jgi:hypothetical protein
LDRRVTLFRHHLAGEPDAAPENWPIEALLAEVRADLFHRTGLSIPEVPTAYAVLLRDLSRRAVKTLTEGSDFWQGHLKAAFLSGPAATGQAFPFYRRVAGEDLPPETARLINVIYNWLFTFLGKAPDLSGTRFLDADISSELNVHLFLTNPEKMSSQEVETRMQEVFLKEGNFTPQLSCSVEAVDKLNPEMVLSGHCIYGWAQAADTLKWAWESWGETAVMADCRTAIIALAREMQKPSVMASIAEDPLLVKTDQIVSHYWRARETRWPTICLDWQDHLAGSGSGWRAENAAFFQLLKLGKYDRLVIEDATKDLGDVKGAEKENRFTISRVLGLEEDGRLTPAHDMVLKLRGLTAYRGDINNWLDLLKEYTSYAYIHNRLSGSSPHLLEIGPLLLTCEKLVVPFDQEETRHWIGFFMQALNPPDRGRAFTSRVRFVTDFWAPRQAVGRVLRVAKRSALNLDEASLVENLRDLAVGFWSYGLSLTYCDLVLYLDGAQRVTGMHVIDLERLTYSELVDEEHLLLDVMVDIKAHLRKESWYPVLNNLFRSRRDAQGFRSFSALRPYLYPRSRRRQLLLRVLHSLHRQTRRLGPRRGQAVWTGFLRVWARLSSLSLRFG